MRLGNSTSQSPSSSGDFDLREAFREPLQPISGISLYQILSIGTVLQTMLSRIPEGEPWHYRYDRKVGLLEPVQDKCPTKEVKHSSDYSSLSSPS